MAKPITSRKLDLLYLVFFVIHVPIIIFVDIQPLYPEAIRPAFTVQLREYYINTYHDLFFTQPPAWFYVYTVLEAVYHLPFSIWAVRALMRDDPQAPLHILIFAVMVATTTLTCLVDMLSWEGYTRQEQGNLAALYVPYLVLALVMVADMFKRLRKTINEAETSIGYKKWM